MVDVDFVIDPTYLQDNDPYILQAFLSQTDDRFIQAGFYSLIFEGLEKSLALTHSLVIKNATSFMCMGQIEILSQVAFEFFEGRSMFQGLGYLEPAEHFRLIQREPGDERMITVVKISSLTEQNALVSECQLMRKSHSLCLGPMVGNELGAFITEMPKGLNVQECLHRLNYRQINLSPNDRIQLTEQILRTYIKQALNAGATLCNLSHRTVYIDLERMEVTFIDYRTTTSAIRPLYNRYSAPETLINNCISPASNVFSLGLIIGELWGDIGMIHHKPRQPAEALALLHRRRWIGLFDEMEMCDTFQQDIVCFLNQLTELDPLDRPTPREALKSWHGIQARHFTPDLSSFRWNNSPLALSSIYDRQEPPFHTPTVDTRERRNSMIA